MMNEKIEKILNDMVPIGVLTRTHGLRGELRFVLFTNVLEILENLDEVFLYSEDQRRGFFLRVESIRTGSKTFLIKFEEFDTKEDAEVLKGFKVFVRREELPELGEDEYYYEQILGCRVYEEEEDIGEVVDVIETGSNEVLVVEKDGKETLVPLVRDYVESVNVEDRIIKVKKMEWI